ncbi:MAG: polysaccharide pyruvyl transferase family protein [Alistipes sp.]|nr:polysaccharide pyruvyl transferase family protein [Alistipes sp.]
MNIGIVTQPLSRNYGGILQNYALQQTLIKLGHTPYTFDLRTSLTWGKWFKYNTIALIKRLLCLNSKRIPSPYKLEVLELPLRKFVKNNIKLTSPRQRHLIPQAIYKYKIEAIIVGSDQVWRPKYNSNIEDMYLNFAKNIDIKKMSYAASFGTDEWEYTPKMTQTCKDLAQKFNAISVREESGVDLCKKYLDVNAVHLIDPTMLLTADEYKELVSHIPQSKTKYLFAYILDQTEEKIKYVKKIAKGLGLELIIKGSDSQVSADDSIEKWIVNFRDANYIITDSFHGTVFSIIFNKPFIAVGNEARGMSRFNSLLSKFGLEDRLIDISKEHKFPTSNINWTAINSNVEASSTTAISFLINNL